MKQPEELPLVEKEEELYHKEWYYARLPSKPTWRMVIARGCKDGKFRFNPGGMVFDYLAEVRGPIPEGELK